MTIAGAEGSTLAKTRVDHFLTLTKVTAHTDQDDGSNGESEYCIRVSIDGPPTSQRAERNESVQCVSSDWDETDSRTGEPWRVGRSLPLVGAQGYAGGAWTGPNRSECSPSAFWRMSVELGEADSGSVVARIVEAAAEAVDQAELLGVVARGRLVLFGLPALKISPIVDEFFVDDVETLGRTDLSWATGTGDSGPRVSSRSQSSRHFSVRATKTVARSSGACRSRTLTAHQLNDSSALLAGIAQQTSCGVDVAHIFCKNVKRAADSWSLLRQAADSIGAIRVEEGVRGVGRQKVQAVKRTLIKLLAELAETAAATELPEAPLAIGNQALIRQARSEFDEAARLRRVAEARLDPNVLIQAINSYETVYVMLARLIHPKFNPR